MKKIFYGALVPLSFVACGVEELRWPAEDSGDASGGSESGGTTGFTGGTSGSGGAAFGSGGLFYLELLRGGFVGKRTAEVEIFGIDSACPTNTAIAAYDEVNCLAGSLCTFSCDVGTICYFAGETDFVVGECLLLPPDQGRCSLPCQRDEDCNAGMICMETEVGRSCLIAETPWTADCAADFVATGGAGP